MGQAQKKREFSCGILKDHWQIERHCISSKDQANGVFFARVMQSKPTRLSVRNNSDQETPAATNEGAFQETPADVIDEDEPINLDSRSSQGRPRLAQEKLLNEIGALNKEIAS